MAQPGRRAVGVCEHCGDGATVHLNACRAGLTSWILRSRAGASVGLESEHLNTATIVRASKSLVGLDV